MLSTTNLSLRHLISAKAKQRKLLKTKPAQMSNLVRSNGTLNYKLPTSKSLVSPKIVNQPKNNLLKCKKLEAKSFGRNYLLNRAKKASGLKGRLELSNLKLKLVQKLNRSKRVNQEHTKSVFAQIEKQTQRILRKAISGNGKQLKRRQTSLKEKLLDSDFPKSSKTRKTLKNFFFVRKPNELKKNCLYRTMQRHKLRVRNRPQKYQKLSGRIIGMSNAATEKHSTKAAINQIKNIKIMAPKCVFDFSEFERNFQAECDQSPLLARSEPHVELDSETLKKSVRSSDEFDKISLKQKRSEPFNEFGTFGLDMLVSDYVASPAPIVSPCKTRYQNIYKSKPKGCDTSGNLDLQARHSLKSQDQNFDMSNQNLEVFRPTDRAQETFVFSNQKECKLNKRCRKNHNKTKCKRESEEMKMESNGKRKLRVITMK